MATLAEQLGPSARAEVAWRQCYFARMTGDREATLEAGARALSLAAEAGDARWGSNAHNELALLHAHEGRFTEAADHALGARKLANQTPSEWLRARAIGTQVYVAMESGNVAQAVDLFELSAARYQRAGDRRREALAHANAASVMLDLGRLAESSARLESAIDASRRVGNARTVAVATHNLGVIRRMEGKLDEATKYQALALREAERLNHPRLGASALAETVRLAMARGVPSEAAAASEDAIARADATRSPHLIATALAVRLQFIARTGREDEGTVQRARGHLQLLEKLPLARAELVAALSEFAVDDTALRGAFDAALDQFAEPLETTEDREAFRGSFVRRCQVDPRVAS
jgi:tetratricopeptide (TPR) repeat protein